MVAGDQVSAVAKIDKSNTVKQKLEGSHFENVADI
jgi:hypothetical protein